MIKHCHKVKGEQVITLQMAQQLKTKNLNVAPGQLTVSVKLNYFRDRLTVLMIKIKFRLLQILTMNPLNVKYEVKSSNQLAFHLSAYSIYENFKERYFRSMQSTSWLFGNSGSDSYDKNDMKETVNDLFMLHKTMQKKLKNNVILWTDLNSYFGTW